MILKIARYLLRTRKSANAESGKGHSDKVAPVNQGTTAQSTSSWQTVLTAPIDQLCEAPSSDTVRYAYDLFAEGVYRPFAEREARMAARLARIQAGFATLVARAPYLVEAAFTEHPQVFADMRRLPKRGRP
jgi:hypothetical protein